MKSIIFLLIISLWGRAYSCLCSNNPPFLDTIDSLSIVVYCQVISKSNNITNKKLIKHMPNEDPLYMTVSVKKVLFGNITTDTLTICGGTGTDCRDRLSNYTINGYYIFNLSHIRNYEMQTGYYFFTKNDLVLYLCGYRSLIIENDYAIGIISISNQDTTNNVKVELLEKLIFDRQESLNKK